LLECSYDVVMVFWVVARALLAKGVLGGCFLTMLIIVCISSFPQLFWLFVWMLLCIAVARMFWWLSGRCYDVVGGCQGVARAFWVVAFLLCWSLCT